jgi:hypothetical protein
VCGRPIAVVAGRMFRHDPPVNLREEKLKSCPGSGKAPAHVGQMLIDWGAVPTTQPHLF